MSLVRVLDPTNFPIIITATYGEWRWGRTCVFCGIACNNYSDDYKKVLSFWMLLTMPLNQWFEVACNVLELECHYTASKHRSPAYHVRLYSVPMLHHLVNHTIVASVKFRIQVNTYESSYDWHWRNFCNNNNNQENFQSCSYRFYLTPCYTCEQLATCDQMHIACGRQLARIL